MHTSLPRAAGQRLTDALRDIRRERAVELGRLYITTRKRHDDAVWNGFRLGRDYQSGKWREEASAYATMLSAAQESEDASTVSAMLSAIEVSLRTR